MDPEVQALIELLEVDPIDEDRFRSRMPDWDRERVFGGVVIGQSIRAATFTAPVDRRAHSLHGYFLRPSLPGRETILQVERLRDGKMLSWRRISASQDGKEIFQMIGSFALEESGHDYQLPISREAGDPAALVDDYRFGAIQMRDVGATTASPDGTHESTMRVWFRVKGKLPDNPALHSSIISYMSDMTRGGGRPPSLGDTRQAFRLISLDHAFWLHRSARADRWIFFDIHSLVHSGGRGTIRGTMHDQAGLLIASMAQEMMLRPLDQ